MGYVVKCPRTAQEIAEYYNCLRDPNAPFNPRGQRFDYTTGPGLPSSTNVFVPDHQASGDLVIGYSRNTTDFNLPRYVKYFPCSKSVGLYMKLSSQEQVRVVNTNDFRWADGQARPQHTDGLELADWLYFHTHRYDYGFTLGQMTANQASWGIVNAHSRIHATQCMTARTIRMLTVATTTTNWNTTADADLSVNHTDTATNVAGGFLDQGTVDAPYIRIFMNKTAVLINKETAGVVNAKNLYFIINPNQAQLWGVSAEIREFIKGSYAAKEEINDSLGPNSQYGLPSKLYGYNLVIEDATKITTRLGQPPTAPTKGYVMPDQQVLVCSRPGGLMGVEGSPDFSTLGLFWFEDEMTLETFNDAKNRLIEGHVVENTDEQVLSPLSGYLLTASTSVAA